MRQHHVAKCGFNKGLRFCGSDYPHVIHTLYPHCVSIDMTMGGYGPDFVNLTFWLDVI